jgi:hypothetical protein
MSGGVQKPFLYFSIITEYYPEDRPKIRDVMNCTDSLWLIAACSDRSRLGSGTIVSRMKRGLFYPVLRVKEQQIKEEFIFTFLLFSRDSTLLVCRKEWPSACGLRLLLPEFLTFWT